MNDLKIISINRTQLMGFAILWIMLFHAQIDMGNLINHISEFGYGGVDIFLFLSGFGLFYASQKRENVLVFYKNRFIRIFPIFWASVLILDLCLGNFSWNTILWKMTTVGFWIPMLDIPYALWYISAISAFYLLYPLYFKIFIKKPLLSLGLSCLLSGILTGIYTYSFLCIYPEEKNGLIFFTSRIPVFCIGVYVGWLSCKPQISKNISNIFILSSFIAIVVLFVLSRHLDYWLMRNCGFFYFPFILIVPGISIFLSRCFDKLPLCINRIFIFLGTLSLELYLIHEALFGYVENVERSLHISTRIAFLCIFILTIIGAYILSCFSKLLLKKIV